MANRDKILINEMLCIGCEQCVNRCQGGALEMVDGKARLMNEDYCDGLGVCIGECPVGAITIEKQKAAKLLNVDVPQFAGNGLRMAAPKQQDESQLTHWPIQLHLIGHSDSYFKDSDLLISADCVAYAHPNFHNDILRGRKLVIACPKLDNNKEVYTQKLKDLIDNSMIKSVTVAMMEVPCCSALLQIAKAASERSFRKLPIKKIVVGIRGNIYGDDSAQ